MHGAWRHGGFRFTAFRLGSSQRKFKSHAKPKVSADNGPWLPLSALA